jgi:hypothetical protein
VKITRRQLLAGAGAGALTAAGAYELVDRLTGPAHRHAMNMPVPPEQHVLVGVREVTDEGVEVLVPPLHHQLVTARLKVAPKRVELIEAQGELESALVALDQRYTPEPSGLGFTVAWGLPYFRRYVPEPASRYLPVDLRASKAKGKEQLAILDAIRFPSDRPETILEANDVAILLRSDSLDNIADAAKTIFNDLGDVFELRSIRKGFAGGGFGGAKSLPKQMAMAAGVRGADLIPDSAELFLGFTSTQKAGLGPGTIANIETLGYSDGGLHGYFRGGTHMHVSHLFEDLEAWYINFTHRERVDTAFRPGLHVPSGRLTVRQDPRDVATQGDNRSDYRRLGAIGHSAAIQTASRLFADQTGVDGVVYRKGTAIPQRADFNTLDSPFFWTADQNLDDYSPDPAAGVHFVVFNPTSDDFHRNRLAMDGVLPDGTKLKFDRGDRGQGFNSVLKTTHRQNFLVPPRRHRSFPLAEFLK